MATIAEALGGNPGETIMEALGGHNGDTIADIIIDKDEAENEASPAASTEQEAGE